MEPNDSEIGREIADAVRAVRAGDVQAYAIIVKRFQGPLMTLCTAMLSLNKQEASTFDRVWDRTYGFTGHKNVHQAS